MIATTLYLLFILFISIFILSGRPLANTEFSQSEHRTSNSASYSYQALDMRAGVRVVYFPPHGGCQGEVARPERSPMVAGSKRRRNLVSIFISDYGWLPWPIISQVRVLYQRARKLPMRPLIYRNLTQSAPICARHTSKRWKICLVRGFAGLPRCGVWLRRNGMARRGHPWDRGNRGLVCEIRRSEGEWPKCPHRQIPAGWTRTAARTERLQVLSFVDQH